MHDDGPHIILPQPIVTAEEVTQRLRAAGAILGQAGFSGAQVEDHGDTLLIQIAPGDLPRLQDEAFRDGLVSQIKSLGYAFAAINITDVSEHNPPSLARGEGSDKGD